MRYFISYGDDKFKKSKKRILKEAQNSNFFDECKIFEPKDLSPEFVKEFEYILDKPRGGGYWIWKFDIINQILNDMKDGDFLVYCDAGCTINKKNKNRYFEYLDMLQKSKYGIISVVQETIEREWTTEELFYYFENTFDVNIEELKKGKQYLGGILIMKKCDHVETIFNACIQCIRDDMRLVTDYYNNKQKSYFIENRHDQSILSLIRKIFGSITINWETTTNGPFLETRIRN